MKILTIILQMLSRCIDTTKSSTSKEVYSRGNYLQNEDKQNIGLEYLKVIATMEFRIHIAELFKKILMNKFF